MKYVEMENKWVIVDSIKQPSIWIWIQILSDFPWKLNTWPWFYCFDLLFPTQNSDPKGPKFFQSFLHSIATSQKMMNPIPRKTYIYTHTYSKNIYYHIPRKTPRKGPIFLPLLPGKKTWRLTNIQHAQKHKSIHTTIQ